MKITSKRCRIEKKHYIYTRKHEDSWIRLSESNDNKTRRHPVDLLAGHLFYNRMNNQKPHTIEEQFQLLRLRGMTFSNEEEAKLCLAHISYFRLKYYWSDMRDDETEHDFKEGTSFSGWWLFIGCSILRPIGINNKTDVFLQVRYGKEKRNKK